MSASSIEAAAQAGEWASYASRLDRVRAHIFEHLDERLDLMTLADVACLSPHHWHRVYHALHGETVAETVKRLRLHRAAGDLAHTAMAIPDVARRCGYPSLASFTRIFKSVYGLPPARFRAEGSHVPFLVGARAPIDAGCTVTVTELPCLQAVGVVHAGSYMAVGRAFDSLFAALGACGLASPALKMLAVYEKDPTVEREDDLRSIACVQLDHAGPLPAPLVRVTVAGGPHAVLRHTGPYASMKAAYDWLFGDWLPASGREPADAPVVEHYLNSPRDTAPSALMTDICLPLRPA